MTIENNYDYQQAKTANDPQSPPKQPLVLVVDDDMFMRKILVRYLERENYRVVEASDGMEALDSYTKYQPDLILLDAMMPVLDGFDCCSQLQKLPNGDHIPVLIITALDDRESVDRAYDVGASDYVTKPLHWAVLRQRVRRLLEQANLREQLESVNQQLAGVVQELHRLTSMDGLTKVSSLHSFEQYIAQECQRSQQEHSPLSLIFCDIDFFKNYNESYGHQAGDDCLKKVAQAISGVINCPPALVARYGGEEFAIILPNTNQTDAMNVAIRARDAVQSLQLPHSGSQSAPYITISCGVATMLPTEAMVVSELIQAADSALSKAKAMGRNNIQCSNSEPNLDPNLTNIN
jgi:diguanylate cyclase (GGDEF)-like protein